MNDLELLKAAASAAGVDVWRWHGDGADILDDPETMMNHRWNPLTDDGDALRLAVKLRMLIDCEDAPEETDRTAAIRRAIVMAAANSMTPNVRHERQKPVPRVLSAR